MAARDFGQLQSQQQVGAKGRAAEAAGFAGQAARKAFRQRQGEEVGVALAAGRVGEGQRLIVHVERGAVIAESNRQRVPLRVRPIDQHVAHAAAVAGGDAREAAQLAGCGLFSQGPGDL